MVNPNKRTKKKIIGYNAFSKETGLHVCIKHNGKMEGLQSLSTSPVLNKYCEYRSKNPALICNKCFAIAMHNGAYPDLNNCTKKNTEILTSRILADEEWILLNVAYFRLEAFGDLNNVTQAINYLNFVRLNPQVTAFSWYTKNPWFIEQAFKQTGMKKPKNLIIGISSPCYNHPVKPDRWWFADFVFTVYTAEYAVEHDIQINCGDRVCMECLRCYKHHKGIMYVNEIVKSEFNKYVKLLAKKKAA